MVKVSSFHRSSNYRNFMKYDLRVREEISQVGLRALVRCLYTFTHREGAVGSVERNGSGQTGLFISVVFMRMIHTGKL